MRRRSESSPGPAADLEDMARAQTGDRPKQELGSVGSIRPLVRGATAHEPRLGRVLLANELRVVEAHSSI